MIILIRHAQSEGNKNREIHQMVPDHRVKLTSEGHRQAHEAGRKLRSLLRPDDSLHFFTSPYRRTRETTEGVLSSLSSDSPAPSPFPRHTITVYEEPRLREQDFGNFQPCSAEMERMWLERADYGHFFYRIPNGESAADAYDRVSGFNESLWRLFGEDDFASVCILVTHGLMTRVFLMKWYHWSVEYFEDLRNINHCEFVVMKLNPDNGKYALENRLRTWSELRNEKEQERHRERVAKGHNPTSPSDLTIPIRRRWGGCPDGCSHGIRRTGSRRTARRDTDATRKANETRTLNPTEQAAVVTAEPGLGDRIAPASTTPEPSQHPHQHQHQPHHPSPLSSPSRTPSLPHTIQPIPHHTHGHTPPTASPLPKRPNLAHFHRDSEDHLLHPPRSNFFLHLTGRDGGGSLSGANTPAASEDEHEHEHEHEIPHPHAHSHARRQGHHAARTHSTSDLTSRKPPLDVEHDGDDEGSGSAPGHEHEHAGPAPARRTRSGRYPRSGLVGRSRYWNTTGDTLGDRDGSDGEEEHEHDHDYETPREESGREDDALEAQRRRDQSIRESVY